MVDVAQGELQELVGEDAAGVCEAEQTVVGEDGPQAHSSRMQYSLIAQAAETGVAVHYLNPFADHDVPEDGEEGEDGREGCLAVDDEEGHVVDLEAVRQVSHACPASVGMCDDYHLVSSVDEFLNGVKTVKDSDISTLTLDSWYMWLSTPPLLCQKTPWHHIRGPYLAAGRSCR